MDGAIARVPRSAEEYLRLGSGRGVSGQLRGIIPTHVVEATCPRQYGDGMGVLLQREVLPIRACHIFAGEGSQTGGPIVMGNLNQPQGSLGGGLIKVNAHTARVWQILAFTRLSKCDYTSGRKAA